MESPVVVELGGRGSNDEGIKNPGDRFGPFEFGLFIRRRVDANGLGPDTGKERSERAGGAALHRN